MAEEGIPGVYVDGDGDLVVTEPPIPETPVEHQGDGYWVIDEDDIEDTLNTNGAVQSAFLSAAIERDVTGLGNAFAMTMMTASQAIRFLLSGSLERYVFNMMVGTGLATISEIDLSAHGIRGTAPAIDLSTGSMAAIALQWISELRHNPHSLEAQLATDEAPKYLPGSRGRKLTRPQQRAFANTTIANYRGWRARGMRRARRRFGGFAGAVAGRRFARWRAWRGQRSYRYRRYGARLRRY